MATGSSTADDDAAPAEGVASPRALARNPIAGLLRAPGASAAVALAVLPYLWLAGYVTTTALGLRGDPIAAGDWLTLVFTTYALLSSLALAHRILAVGVRELTREYLVDVVALTWLTGFYFVWMLGRESVSTATAPVDLYGPVLDGQPAALGPAVVVGVAALATARLIHRADEDAPLFRSRFRTALVTLPAAVTAAVLLVQPGPDSLLWPVVAGVVLGTGVAGLLHLQAVANATARGLFATCAFLAWTVGAVAWLLVHRSRPPNDRVVLEPRWGAPAERTGTSGDARPPGGPPDDDE